MKKVFAWLLGCTIYIPLFSNAQSEVDLLRYSQSGLTGTARYTSMGGAFGALGSDFSSLSDNPAGIGVYRKSEFSFTPSIYADKITSSFLNAGGSDNRVNFNISNLGLVFNHRLSNDENSAGWKSINFAIGLNRFNNFSSRSAFRGTNNSSSLLNLFTDQLNKANNMGGTLIENMDDFNYFLFQSYLIDPVSSSDTTHFTPITRAAGELQRKFAKTKGAANEMVLSVGSNYSNKLYIGATLGIDFINYTENTQFSEFNQGNNPGFDHFNYYEDFTTTGAGINFKLGAIYRVTDWLRLGLAGHTPTFYTLHDDYSDALEAFTDLGGSQTWRSDLGSFDYDISTPWKGIASIAFIIGKRGIISLDGEYADYSSMNFSDQESFFDANEFINPAYKPAGNIKAGTEWRIGDIFSVRAGYAFYGSPLKDRYIIGDYDLSRSNYTVGFGFRTPRYFIDFGYAYSIYRDYSIVYDLRNAPVATNKNTSNNFLISFGWRF
jgi:hypothetical protein